MQCVPAMHLHNQTQQIHIYASVVFDLRIKQLSFSQQGPKLHSQEDMPLRKRGDRGGFEGFIDMSQMRNHLLGDPSDSDPGYEVTNLVNKVSK